MLCLRHKMRREFYRALKEFYCMSGVVFFYIFDIDFISNQIANMALLVFVTTISSI